MIVRTSLLAAALAGPLVCSSCKSGPTPIDLGWLYNETAQNIGAARVPVVVLPGILGSKLKNGRTGLKIWGSFTFGAADADKAAGAREVAYPMGDGVPLLELRDDVVPNGALDYVVADIGPFRNIKIGAYVGIMKSLAAGKYRDQSLGESGAIDYGGQHYTCFQYPYDWRRDVSESAAALHEYIADAQDKVREGRGLDPGTPVKVDVVAHSMGGLVLRYYLRYGPEPLPVDGSLPELTWAGAENVARAFLVATPSGGSADSLRQLLDGLDLNPLFPNYRAAILGTMPAIYQLLPRARHGLVRDGVTGERIDVLDIAVWEHYGWGLADPREADVLEWLLPDAAGDDDRARIAKEHLAKCLAKADQLFRALDRPAVPPAGTELYLFAGDGQVTPEVIEISAEGELRVIREAPGDGTVTRASALMDERVGGEWVVGLQSPIAWERVQFINEEHLGLTSAPEFTDNLLYLMLDSPRP